MLKCYVGHVSPDGSQTADVTLQFDACSHHIIYWPTPSVDGKRPYGDFTNYPVEMAQALGLPVRQQANGSLAITPALQAELKALHQQTMPALQVFVREAGLRRNTL